MSLRVRLIRPAYWTDSALHKHLTAEQREFYVGLWMYADDAGYMVWNLEEIGAELYRYRTPAWRARTLPGWAKLLQNLQPDAPHLMVLECGHAVVPNVERHNRYGSPNYPIRDEHLRRCTSMPLPHGRTRQSTAVDGSTRASPAVNRTDVTRLDETSRATARGAPPASAQGGAGGAQQKANGPAAAAGGVTREAWAALAADDSQPAAIRADAQRQVDAMDQRWLDAIGPTKGKPA